MCEILGGTRPFSRASGSFKGGRMVQPEEGRTSQGLYILSPDMVEPCGYEFIRFAPCGHGAVKIMRCRGYCCLARAGPLVDTARMCLYNPLLLQVPLVIHNNPTIWRKVLNISFCVCILTSYIKVPVHFDPHPIYPFLMLSYENTYRGFWYPPVSALVGWIQGMCEQTKPMRPS